MGFCNIVSISSNGNFSSIGHTLSCDTNLLSQFTNLGMQHKCEIVRRSLGFRPNAFTCV